MSLRIWLMWVSWSRWAFTFSTSASYGNVEEIMFDEPVSQEGKVNEILTYPQKGSWSWKLVNH